MSQTHDPALLAKAETLAEALPYLQRYAGRTFVVKYGGHAMGDLVRAVDRARGAREAREEAVAGSVVLGAAPVGEGASHL